MTMPYTISDKALRRFSQRQLKVIDASKGRYHFAFQYQGSACRDFEISAVIHVELQAEKSGHRIEQLRVEILPQDIGFPMTCQYSARGADYLQENFEASGVVGTIMEAFLQEDRPCNPAGCFCEPEQVNHKLTLVLLTINYYLQHL